MRTPHHTVRLEVKKYVYDANMGDHVRWQPTYGCRRA